MEHFRQKLVLLSARNEFHSISFNDSLSSAVLRELQIFFYASSLAKE